MFERILKKKALGLAKTFPAIAITGPRQSGKTTLCQMAFPHKPYVNLENPDTLEYAVKDPRGFLEEYPEGAILDEVQRTPKLFSYLQDIIDRRQISGMYILTGSQQFGMMEKITQSLAGRVALLELLPLSLDELKDTPQEPRVLEEIIFKGFYPRLHHKAIEPEDWFANYLQTYVERDVRLIKNIGSLHDFQKFVRMCAARTGQILNLSAMGSDCGITHNTAKSWLSILEASYLVFLLKPHHKNFNKRMIKAPKIHLWDTGLACYLLGIRSREELSTHANRGNLFETWVTAECMKQFLNQGRRPPLFFWHDQRHEVDLIVEKGNELTPIEIKAGKTVAQDYFDHLSYWCHLAKKKPEEAMLIYAGENRQNRKEGKVFGWNQIPQLT